MERDFHAARARRPHDCLNKPGLEEGVAAEGHPLHCGEQRIDELVGGDCGGAVLGRAHRALSLGSDEDAATRGAAPRLYDKARGVDARALHGRLEHRARSVVPNGAHNPDVKSEPHAHSAEGVGGASAG